MGTLELLDIKLKESIMNEDYENSAKIRDLINSLKEDENKNPKQSHKTMFRSVNESSITNENFQNSGII